MHASSRRLKRSTSQIESKFNKRLDLARFSWRFMDLDLHYAVFFSWIANVSSEFQDDECDRRSTNHHFGL